MASAINPDLPGATVHFSPFTLTKISLNNDNHEKIVVAAQLLADAKVNIIGWMERHVFELAGSLSR